MKKIFFIILVITLELVLLTNKTQHVFIEKIDLKLKTNELAITFLFSKDNKTLLLNTKENKILIVLNLNNKTKILTDLENFNSSNLTYLLGFKYYDITSDNKMIIKKSQQIENIIISEDNHNLKINYLDHNFCFYFNDYKQNFNNCHYVYIEKPNDDTNFLDEPELILYYNLNEEFTEEMYDKWVDTFYLDPAYYNVIKFNIESYNIVNIPINSS